MFVVNQRRILLDGTRLRTAWRKLLATAAVVAVLSSVLSAVGVVFHAPPAHAATLTFLVNSLSHQGDDAAIGDGACATATGECTLRAALQEANALPPEDIAVIAPAEDVDSATEGVQSEGNIVASGTGFPVNWMIDATPDLTRHGDLGAYFMATRSMILDFQNRLGVTSLSDGSTTLYLNGPDVELRNFSNIGSNETAIVFGPDSDGTVVENGTCIDAGSSLLERCFWLNDGADSVTIRNVETGSPWAGGGAVMIANGATINGLTLDRIRMFDPDAERYQGFDIDLDATLNDLTITGSTFEGFLGGLVPVDLRGATVNNAVITGNTFSRVNADASIWFDQQGTNNVITDNVFDNAGAFSGNHAITNFGMSALTGTTPSGWTIEDNYFNGFDDGGFGAIRLYGAGITPVVRNTFGPENLGLGAPVNETDTNALFWNDGNSNQKINTWFPTAVSLDQAACTLDVVVEAPTAAPIPETPVTIDVFFTPTTKAEVYLGSQTDITESPTTITVPYTLGTGNIRVQTQAATDASSQYSRVFAQPDEDLCSPSVTIDQAVSQDDPTSVRDVLFTVELSEPVAANLLAEAISADGSTAPGVTVTDVTRISGSTFQVTARANGSGDIVLSLPEGAILDDAGNPSSASTSTDNVVTYVSPLTIEPTSIEVTEAGAPASYTVTSALPATAPITIAPTTANPEWLTVGGSQQIDTIATAAAFEATAVDDTIINGTRTTTITHVVTSDDPNFDGLILPAVETTVVDNDTPSPPESTLEVTPAGPVIADGTSEYTATITVRNADGTPVSGATVQFSVTGGPVLSANTCVSDESGTCSTTATSTAIGTFPLSAQLDGTETTGSPADLVFVNAEPSPLTSTIEAGESVETDPGTFETPITVTLFDEFGNPLTTGGDTVTMDTTTGELSDVVDNGDGTYSAILTAPSTAGESTVSFTVNGEDGVDTVTVTYGAGVASPSTSTIEASPTSIVADGAATSTITVTLLDGQGTPIPTGGDDVVVTTTAGTVSEVTDNGDGTHTATLTSSTIAEIATVGFTVNGATGAATVDVEFTPGTATAETSSIAASPTEIAADGVSTSTVTVTLLDANGNTLTTGGDEVTIGTDLGAVGDVSDNGDGSYTATLTSATSTGDAILTFTVNGADGGNTATVAFVAGPASPTESTISADPTEITADGVSTSTVTVTLLDANGNPLTTGGDEVTIGTDLGTVGLVTDNGDGTYTATLTSSTTAGDAAVSFTVNGLVSPNTATVTFTPGEGVAENSTIAASPTQITADGMSTSTVTVTVFDANGNQTLGGDTVTVVTTAGTLSDVTDNGDGTYTAILTSSTTAQTATVSFTVNDVGGSETAEVEFVAGVASPETSTIEADPTAIVADGVSTSTVTVTLFDAVGNPITTSGGTVVILTSAGTVTPATDNGDGTYTATLTSSTDVETADLTFALNGVEATDTAAVDFVPGPVDLGASTIEASATVVEVGGNETTITVTLTDAQGNPVGGGGANVEILATAGTVGLVTDNGDGTYTAVLTSPEEVGEATVSYTVGGEPGQRALLVTFVAGEASPARSTIEADPTAIAADGTATSMVTVTLLDAFDNVVTDAGDIVAMTTDAGTLSDVTNNGDGTYTATLMSSTTVETATVSFTVDGSTASAMAEVDFVAGPAAAGQSTISASPTSILADGSSTSAITVQLFDANGNPLTTGGDEVTMSTDLGTLGAVTDNDDGTYTSTLTSAPTVGTATVGFAVNGVDAASTASVVFVAGPADAGTSTIEANPTEVTAGGSATITVTLFANGNPLGVGGDDVTITADLGSVSDVTDNGDGTYTATLTSAEAGTATVGFTVNGQTGASTATVEFTVGAASPETSTVAADPTEIVADGESTSTITVTLLDANGDPITTGGDAVEITTDLGTLGAVTDNGDGTYTATLTSDTSAGTATIGFTVNGDEADATAAVEFVARQLSIDLSDATVPQGAAVDITGFGFLPGEEVAGLIESNGPIDLGTQIAEDDGTVTFTAQIPGDYDLGEHVVTLTGVDSGSVTATLTVTAGPTPSPTPAPVDGTIPDTGGPGAGLVWLAGIAVVLGILITGSAAVWRRKADRRIPMVSGQAAAPGGAGIAE